MTESELSDAIGAGIFKGFMYVSTVVIIVGILVLLLVYKP